MIVMFFGLYVILWAKQEEDRETKVVADDNVRSLIDASEKPLLV